MIKKSRMEGEEKISDKTDLAIRSGTVQTEKTHGRYIQMLQSLRRGGCSKDHIYSCTTTRVSRGKRRE